jgi:tetratricopeptide (TPR) repeat protein
MAGDLGTAVAHDEETVRLGSRNGVDRVRLMGMVRRATNYIALLDWDRGIPAVESALEEAIGLGSEEAVATVRMTGSATAKLARGDIVESLEESTETLATLDRYGSFFLALAHNQIARCHYQLGNIDEALSHFLDVTRVAAALGQPFTGAAGSSGMALVYATVGLTDEVPGLRGEALDQIHGPIGEFLASTVLADLGWVSWMLGDHVAALGYFTEGLSASSTTQFLERPRLLIGKALAHLEFDDIDSADSDLARARDYVRDKELDLYVAHLDLAQGLLANRREDHDLATQSLSSAKEAALSRGQRIHLLDIEVERARIAARLGDAKGAATSGDSARSVLESIADGIVDETLRASYLERWDRAIASIIT